MGPKERKTKDIVWYMGVDDRVPKPLRPIGDLDEMHEWPIPKCVTEEIANRIKKEFHVPVYIDLDAVTTTKKPEPEPKKVYLTTHNPYMSKDWKRFFDEQIKANPHLKYFDTDVASLYPAYFVPARGSAKTDPVIKEILRLEKIEETSEAKAMLKIGEAIHEGFLEGFRKSNQAIVDAVNYIADCKYYCEKDEKMKEEDTYDWMSHSWKEIMADMGTILHRRQITEKEFKSKEWVWVISKDIWQRLKEKPEFITNCYSTSLPASIYCIDVRVTNLKTNYIKLVRKVKKEENMNSLYNNNRVTITAADGTKYAAAIRTIDTAPGELDRLTIDMLEPVSSSKHYGHYGYSAGPTYFDEFLMSAALRPKKLPLIDKVIFNDPATIVYWKDGTKTVVQARDEKFDPEKGLAMAISKKAMGNTRDYYIPFKKWLKKFKKKEEKLIAVDLANEPMRIGPAKDCVTCQHSDKRPGEYPCVECAGYTNWEPKNTEK